VADAPASQRELAVARSLGSARLRAESRVERFLEAATELLREGAGREFTVQEVVERSGLSLRSFYQHFAGKHELLLALFEDSIRTTAAHLVGHAADIDDPVERLHALVVEYHRLCRVQPSRSSKKLPGRSMSEFAQQLLTSHPTEAAQCFAPLVEVFESAVAGVVEDLDARQTAGVLLEAIMFNAFARTISDTPPRDDDAEVLWQLFSRGLAG
jgi:AcrR family transcriptional regulator